MVKMKELLNTLLELKNFSLQAESWVILVEGKKDVKALKKFGVENVVELRGRNYHTVAEELSKISKGVVLLMDCDERGERIFQKFLKILPTYGLKANTHFREKLKSLGVKYIENLTKIPGGKE